MDTHPETWKIKDIIDASNDALLAPNPEYQRGSVWQKRQQQMLIDSLLRGYHLPVFYFHVRQTPTKHGVNTRYEIIDGQQRVNSITGFRRGDFTLLDPIASDSRFARHLRDKPCEWAKLSYDQLPTRLRDELLDREVTVAEILDATIDEARDLFVRLQQGADLTAQERRDALPGEFGGAVEKIAGRDGRSHGHSFFQDIMRMKPRSDRGRTRQFVAQLLAAIFEWSTSGKFIDLDKAAIDRHYYDYMELRDRTAEVEQFEHVLNDVYQSLRGWRGRKVPNHLALHLIVMWHQLQDRYTNSWKSQVYDVVQLFMNELSEANSLFKAGTVNNFYAGYVSGTKAGSDKRDSITRRHSYFLDWMRSKLDLTPKSSRTSLSVDDRHLVFTKTQGKCAYADNAQICGDNRDVNFDEGEAHHVMPVSKGGKNTLDNLVWTHAECNRKIGDRFVPPPGWSDLNGSIGEGVYSGLDPFSMILPNPNISASG